MGRVLRREIVRTVALNRTAVAALCRVCLPFMGRGSRILNVSSASAFQPTPYLALYAATKAFELSYSRALGAELAGSGATVCAVCPSWVDTLAIALGAAGEAPAARFVLKSQQPGDGSPAPARTGCDGR